MKRHITLGWRILMAIAVAGLAASCSDGSLLDVSGDIVPPAPIIITFKANPNPVKAGGNTDISWEVSGADKVEITAVAESGPAPAFHVETTELSGTSPATGLTATTSFTLTATKTSTSTETSGASGLLLRAKAGQIVIPEPAPAPPQPSESVVSQTITVAVLAGIEATITADDPVITAGEQTVIRWEVTSPAGGDITTVVTADTGEQFAATDQCDGDIATILAQPPMDPMPAKGCAVVAPTARTAYTVKGTDATGSEGTASTTVDVTEANVDAKIYVGADASQKEKLLMVDSFANPITVQWEVKPAGAKITVTAEMPTGVAAPSCQPALPQDVSDKAMASSSAVCTLSGETKFKIHAELGGSSDDDEAGVAFRGGNVALVISDPWAFDGEKVALDMELDDATKPNASIVENVLVNDASISSDLLNSLKQGNVIQVAGITARLPHVKVKLVYGGGKEMKYERVEVVDVSVKALDEDVAGVKSMALVQNANGDIDRFAGVQMGGVRSGKVVSGFNDGIARVYKNGGAINFGFGNAIKAYSDMQSIWTSAFFEAMKTYPTAVAVRDGNPQEIYAAPTGAVMRSTDGGATWKDIAILRIQSEKKSDTPVTHPTCGRADEGGQRTQAGAPAPSDHAFVSLHEVCDVVARKDGRVIIGTDWGVYVEQNIDNGSVNLWIGKPADGKTGADVGALTYGHVVNKLVDVMAFDSATDMIFAAADHGVFKSVDGGIHWEQFGDITGPVYALAYDARNKILFAGTENGVSSSPIDAANWKPVGSIASPVLSLAIDPSAPLASTTILAGTPTGISIMRDGATWAKIMLQGGDQPVEALGMLTKAEGDTVKYGIGIGTSLGELFRTFKVMAMSSAPAEEPKADTLPPGTVTDEPTGHGIVSN
jgi:hypothetical protein